VTSTVAALAELPDDALVAFGAAVADVNAGEIFYSFPVEMFDVTTAGQPTAARMTLTNVALLP